MLAAFFIKARVRESGHRIRCARIHKTVFARAEYRGNTADFVMLSSLLQVAFNAR